MKSTAPSSILSAFGTLSFSLIFGGFSMQHGLTHAQCLDSEALLQVSYNDPTWENEHHDDVIIRLVDTLNITDLTKVSYPANATFTFEKCIARDDTCGHIAVDGPPKDLYEISWDGRVLTDTEIGPEILAIDWIDEDKGALFTTTQFGDGCKPECGSDEALFEFQLREYKDYFRPYISNWILQSYFVEDQNGTEIIAGYDRYGPDGPQSHLGLHIKRMCLPKDDCYRLVMRDPYDGHLEHVAVFFDDKPIFKDRPLYFESVDFGYGCPRIRSCDPDKESKVQLFIESERDSRQKLISWELTGHDAVSGSQIIHSGKQSDNYSITLLYDEICVPRQSCMTFSLAEQQNDNKTRRFDGYFMLRMDDIIYRYTFTYNNTHTIHLGDCAKVMSSICNPANETLLELNFQTKPKSSSSINDFPDVYDDTLWSVMSFQEVEDDDGSTMLGPKEDIFDTFDLPTRKYEYDSAYRALRCIPNIKCLYRLVVWNKTYDDRQGYSSLFESYSIKMNGKMSTAETVVDPDFYGDGFYVTALDNDCSNDFYLSGGAIAGIVIASLVVVAGIGVLMLKKCGGG